MNEQIEVSTNNVTLEKQSKKKLFSIASFAGGGTFILIAGICGMANDAIEKRIADTDISSGYRDIVALIQIGGFVLAIVGGYFVQQAADGKRLTTFFKFAGLGVVLAIISLFI